MVGLDRYNRQYILSIMGREGQEELLNSRIAIIGCGALGCQSSTLLARAGIGYLRVIDRDVVELDNLQRQTLYDEGDVGEPKALAAQRKLKAINSEVKVEGVVDDANFTNILDLISDVDLVVDGTDNMETRYLINDACVKEGIPFVYGGAISTYGMTMTIIPGQTACFRCVFPRPPRPGSLPTCDTIGVLNTIPAIIASIQVTNAIKIILGAEPQSRLVIFDVWTSEFTEVNVGRREQCSCCSSKQFEFLDAERKNIITSLCGRNAISINPLKKGRMNLGELGTNLKKLGDVKEGSSILIFRTGDFELMIFQDGRAIIKGTDDEKLARSLYSKYVGH
jgi:adenylyltransferase/sulfurtransferase